MSVPSIFRHAFRLEADIPVLELLWYLFWYGTVLFYHTRRTVFQYSERFQKSSSVTLSVHIATSLAEVFRYLLRSLRGPASPNPLDVGLSVLHSATILMLAKPLLRGEPIITRPCYQAAAMMRPVLSIAAYSLSSQTLHRASVHMINAFLYTRIGIFILERSGVLHSYSAVYAASVYVAGNIAIVEGGLPGGIHAYNALVLALVLLNRAVSRLEVQREESPTQTSSKEDLVIRSMVALGFAELETIKNLEGEHSLPSDVEDEYTLQATRSPMGRAETTCGQGESTGTRRMSSERQQLSGVG